ncbi:hypothetical protein GGF46_001672 [Coemansia sp. RSA 552]|nr:hypothetical protein GGF46_001672 [Coemansia sp. RSA 552]
MRATSAVAEERARRTDTTLAELLSGNKQTLCSTELESEVSHIRQTSNWVHSIVQRCRNAQKKKAESYLLPAMPTEEGHEAPHDEAQDVRTCLVAPGHRGTDRQAAGDAGSEAVDDGPGARLADERFGRSKGRAHLYPVQLEPASEASAPPRSDAVGFKLAMLLLVQMALLIYLVSLRLALKDHLHSPFSWHPILMSVALVLSTEAIVILQFAPWPVPKGRRRPARTFHYTAHALSGLTQVIGIGQFAANYGRMEALPPLRARGTSAHAVLGGLSGLTFIAQVGFGIYITCGSKSGGGGGGQRHAKHLHKYHRAFGYLVLALQWTAAWLGIHSHWLRDSGGGPGELTWFCCFAMVIVGVLLPVDMAKFGL